MADHRSVVKHSYLTQKDQGKARAQAHIRYIQFRAGKDKEEDTRSFFNAFEDNISGFRVSEALSEQNQRDGAVMHKLVLSPGVGSANMQEYTREVMADLSSKKGLDLDWYAVQHDNTDNPHCHIVVMGKDLHGHKVRLSKDDYTRVKEAGDRYLERNRLLEKEKDKSEKNKNFGKRLFSALRAAKKEFDKTMKGEAIEERKLRRYELLKQQEEKTLGEAPDYKELAMKSEERDEKQKARIEEAWQYYAKPIDIAVGDERIEYTWQNRLSDLRDLERQYLDQKPDVLKQLGDEDFKRLETWIKDAWYVEKRLEVKAAKIDFISSKNQETLSKNSSLKALKELKALDESGEINLSEPESRALSLWIEDNSKLEPILVKVSGMDEPVVYDKDDSRESLEFLANEYRNGEPWAQEAVSKEEYKKLREWIQEKRLDEKERPNR